MDLSQYYIPPYAACDGGSGVRCCGNTILGDKDEEEDESRELCDGK